MSTTDLITVWRPLLVVAEPKSGLGTGLEGTGLGKTGLGETGLGGSGLGGSGLGTGLEVSTEREPGTVPKAEKFLSQCSSLVERLPMTFP